jgi:hypothetical protein
MNSEELKELLRQKEGVKLDFKQELTFINKKAPDGIKQQPWDIM